MIHFLWEGSLPIILTTELLLENQKLIYVSLDKAPFSMETRGLDKFSSCLLPTPTTTTRSL